MRSDDAYRGLQLYLVYLHKCNTISDSRNIIAALIQTAINEIRSLERKAQSLDELLAVEVEFTARAHMLFANHVMQGEDCKQEAEEWVKDFLDEEESEGRDVER